MTSPTRYGRARPGRPWGPIPASVAIVLGWWLVAHSSGQGWVQDLGDLVAAAILVGLLGPWLALRRIRVEIDDAPTDGSAGLPVELTVRTTRPARLRPVLPAGPDRTDGALTLLPTGRGVFTSVRLDVATAAPFGLQWWTRRVELPLPHQLHIAPRRGPAHPLDALLPDDGTGTSGPGRRPGPDGDLRAPRPYRAGDARRLVHWPASAHTGELMVRELERPLARPAEMVVSLPPDPERAEAEAERAFGTVLALLDRDVAVLLTTEEGDGMRTALVQDRRDAGRRMAAAV
ncbi:MAG TPA: DUF58 domain-containing protein [Acidimicrobiales bacterium]|nr:DUF58 domain-containing protein [Acidimicrobiales bacterium]